MAEGTQLAVQIEELNQNLKIVSSALVDLTEQLGEIQEVQKASNSVDQVHRTSGYVNWNSTHNVLKTEKWVTMSAFLKFCLDDKHEDSRNILKDNTIQLYAVNEKTRFPENQLYVNLDNPFVRAKLLYIEATSKPLEVERIFDISKGEAHTVSSFEKEQGLKWEDPTPEISYEPEPIHTTKPVSKTVSKNSAPNSWASEELQTQDSHDPETSSKKEDPLSEEDLMLITNFASILDKIAAYNYYSIREVKEQLLKVNNQKLLDHVTGLFYNIALDNPDSSYVYAALAKEVVNTKVPSDNDPNTYVSFRGVLVDKLKRDFEEILNNKSDYYFDENRKLNLAIITFIGELYEVGLLSSKAVNYCLHQLINEYTNDSLEYFCVLIAIVGEKFDESGTYLEHHFQKLHGIINRHDNRHDINARVMIEDIINLRQRKWVTKAPKLIKNLPKTIDEIQDENQKRALLIQLMNEFGSSGIKQKEQTKVIHKDHNRELAGVNLYSVEALKLEAASQKTQDYIQAPPECFTELGDDILDKLQADGATRNYKIINKQTPLQMSRKIQPDLRFIKYIKYIIDQHIVNPVDEELMLEIRDNMPIDHGAVVSLILDIVLEKSVKEVKIIAKSFLYLVDMKTIAPVDFLAGLKTKFDVAPDLIIDIPYLYKTLGIIIAPLIVKNHITIEQIFEVSQTVILNDQGNNLLSSILLTLNDTNGLAVTRALWIKSGMRVSQWMKEVLVTASLFDIIGMEAENI